MSEGYMPIKSWAEDERPREKMLARGPEVLSTAELVAILLRSGSGGESALGLARRLLGDQGNDLNRLARLGVEEMASRYKGMGVAKAASVVAAMELGRRRALAEAGQTPVLQSSVEIYNYLRPRLGDLEHEEFWVVLLGNGCRLRGCERMFTGGWEGTLVDTREVFRRALEVRATAIAVAHNHPSGNTSPSRQDIELTNRLKDAGKVLNIALVDHIIVCINGYYSFADEGQL